MRDHEFSSRLQNELVRRLSENRNYSLRAFAQYLEIHPSSLSRILRNERRVSSKIKARLGKRLGWEPSTVDQFENGNRDEPAVLSMNQLRDEEFTMISDWYHYAILELVTLKSFEPNHSWISRALGISTAESQAAIARLLKLKLLKETKTGKWIPAHAYNTNLSGDTKKAAFRALQRSILNGAISALEQYPLTERDQTSMTMAIAESEFPRAIKMIDAFRQEFAKSIQKSVRGRDRVYQLTIGFYPITPSFKQQKRGKQNEKAN